MKLLIKTYQKFISKHTKYYKSPILNLDHYEFINLGFYEKQEESPIDVIKKVIKIREFRAGHIVWRYIYDLWKFPYIEIHYNKKVK